MNAIKLLLLAFLVSANLSSQVNMFNRQFLSRQIDLNCTNFNAVQQTYDKGYIMCRGTRDTVLGVVNKYVELIKRNREGDAMWAKRLLRGDSINNGAFNTIAQNSQNELVIATSIYSTIHTSEIVLVGMDSTGVMLWAKKYSGEGKSKVFKVMPTSDNGYLVIGSTTDGGNVETPYYFKIDNAGNYTWGKKLRLGTDTIGLLYSCIELPGEGYLFAGQSMHKALAIKTDL